MESTDLAYLTIGELADLISRREVSSYEVTTNLINRIEHINPKILAYVEIESESATQAAKAADAYIAAGYRLGPIHGVPVGLKDLLWEQGVPSRAGSKVLDSFSPVRDAAVVHRLRQEGAIFVGRLNMHEFAYGVSTENPHFGTACNPWDITRSVGGSSGGSGAAVAAGLCYGALGTDTGCSVRLPAAYSGIVGLRPTMGRISTRGVEPLAPTLDTVGPMTRTVRDCATVFEAIAGYDQEIGQAPGGGAGQASLVGQYGLSGLTIGVVQDFSFKELPGYFSRAMSDMLEVCESLGATIAEREIPHIEHSLSALTTINIAEPSAYHGEWMRNQTAQLYGSDVLGRLDLGEHYLASHYIQAQRYRELLRREFRAAFDDGVDCFVMPTIPFEAPEIGTELFEFEDGTSRDLIATALLYNSIASLIGSPSLAIPCGVGPNGMPLGAQLVGDAFAEATLFKIGDAYEDATSWTEKRPGLTR